MNNSFNCKLNPTICSYPFNSLYNLPGGNYGPCCWAKKSQFGPQDTLPFDYFDSEEFKRLRREMLLGEKTDFLKSICYQCYKLEEESNASPRQRFPIEETVLKNFNSDGSLKKTNNRFFNLTINIFGSYCNLECYECHSFNSTSRNSRLKELGPKWTSMDPFKLSENVILDKIQFDKIINQIIEYSNNILSISLIGGEPMLMKSHFYLLDELIKCEQSKNIKLSYVSNMTLMNLELMEKYFDNFSGVNIQWSVDALDDRNGWLRYPTDWNSTVKNVFEVRDYLKATGKGKITSTITPSLLSITTLRKTVNWLHLRGLSSPKKYIFNVINEPKILRSRNLPDEIKEKIGMSVKSICEFQYNDLMQERSEEDFQLAIKYCDDLDKSRGTDWRSTFPEIAKYAN